MRYAAETSVSVEKSRAEIEASVMRYGATGFTSGWLPGRAAIMFEMHDRRIRFNLPLPDQKEERFWLTRHKNKWQRQRVDEATARANWEQACRQKWRALALAVKAKLESVESGISTFEEEFMANIVLPDGLTIGETILPGLPGVFEQGRKLPPLLPGPPN